MGKQHKEIISKCQKEQYQTKNVGIRMTIPRSCAVLSRSVVSDSATPWTVAHQAPLSMEFSRQEYWSE